MTKQELQQAMKKVEVCMMTTVSSDGTLHSRPMSNNTDVELNGDTYFFTLNKTETIKDLNNNSKVSLTYQGQNELYIQLYGEATLVEQKEKMEEKWHDELVAWFPNGLDTEGICMIHVEAKWAEYWQNEKSDRIEF